MSGLGFDDEVPGVISATTHAYIDYVHAATNFLFGFLFRNSNKAASNAAFAIGASVLINTLNTDYPLGIFRLYSFRVHGVQDYSVAAASGLIPALCGFAGEKEAIYFYAQAAAESTIAALTDYNDSTGEQKSHTVLPEPFSSSRAA
jgi:hypothetical protein